ncbi:MAG TPA: DUF5666 domain-containing protein [Candidatus Sulfotelmatobacter sp.]|nr:DUF5666 domain-containing protein [Candidatus Sulfotelmatobacter sp.]
MSSVEKFVFLGLIIGSFAYAQAPAEPAASKATSAVISAATESNIKPEPAGIADASKDDKEDTEIVADPASLLPDLPPVPGRNATLIGGTVERLDRVRDQLTVRVFGGGRMNVLFDPRTRIYRRGTQGTIGDLHEGERVYIDTILDGSTVFARSIRVKTQPAVGESQGIVLTYQAERGELTIRDAIFPEPLRVRTNSSTRLMQGDRTVPVSVLTPGSLIAIRFASEPDGHDVAREISILALPGTRYTFRGQVVHIDLRSGLLVLYSSTDRKSYEIHLDPSLAPDDNLRTGAVVTAITTLEESRYVVRSLTINSPGK